MSDCDKCLVEGCKYLQTICVTCGRLVSTAILPKLEWISVKDRLPEMIDNSNSSSQSEDVLFLNEGGNMYVGVLNFYGISRYRKEEKYSWSENSTGCGCCCGELNVTHWMPLPPPPKE